MALRIVDHTMTAIAVRLANARQSPAFASRRAEVVREALGAIQAAGGASVPVLKALGGLSAVVQAAIGPAPAVPEFGIPTDPAWWVWRALMNDAETLRFEVQKALTFIPAP